MTSSDSFLINSNVTVCCFGANAIGVPISTVIAYNCPNIHISVVDFDPNQIHAWSEKEVPIQEPFLEKMFQKCLNENLMLTTDMRTAIVLADIVFIAVEIPIIKSNGQITLSMKEFEEAARTIAKMSESSKIIVQKCAAPFKTFEYLKSILNANKLKHVNFQILTVPEFFSSGSALSNLLHPEIVLIGRDRDTEDHEAAATMATIISNWVPWDRIKIMNNDSAELVRIGINCLLAERLTSVGALAVLSEHSGRSIFEFNKILRNSTKDLGEQRMEPGFCMGELNLKKDILNLLQLCRRNNFSGLAEYWEEILYQSDYQERKFIAKILNAFGNKVSDKKFAIFGISYGGDGEITSELPAIKLTGRLLNDGATLSLYDPNTQVDKGKIIESLKDHGVKDAEHRMRLFEDPYAAAFMADGIIFCSNLNCFKSLDYAILHRDMMKPAHIFDGENGLNHESLMRMGFIVRSMGGGF